jgi:hypothetical protein
VFVGFELFRSDASEFLTVFPCFKIMLKLDQSVFAHGSDDFAIEAYAGLNVVLCSR